MKKKLVNHVALVIDDSGSMNHLVPKTREVVSNLIKGFKATSGSVGQETRLSIYTFGDYVQNRMFDANPDSAPQPYTYILASSGMTALRDAAFQGISDLSGIRETKFEDHAFLVYVITDGGENHSRKTTPELKRLIDGLNDDWTVAALVPDLNGKHQAKLFGFPADNIQIWETTEKGLEEVERTVADSYRGYSMGRSMGIKSSASLFKFNDVSKTEVKKKLEEVDPGDYETLLVRKYDHDKAIKDFVESWTSRPYRVGSAYYQVTKPEKIQAGKNIAVVDKLTGKMYSGLKARQLIGLPTYEVKAAPADFKNFDLFVQSTSTNRKLVGETHLIVFK
jgi:hypothetical protein